MAKKPGKKRRGSEILYTKDKRVYNNTQERILKAIKLIDKLTLEIIPSSDRFRHNIDSTLILKSIYGLADVKDRLIKVNNRLIKFKPKE